MLKNQPHASLPAPLLYPDACSAATSSSCMLQKCYFSPIERTSSMALLNSKKEKKEKKRKFSVTLNLTPYSACK
jgi:hypothetical protein